MTDKTLMVINHAALHVEQAIEALDDTHLLDDERLDDTYRNLIDIKILLRSVHEEYFNVDTQDWDTDIGDM